MSTARPDVRLLSRLAITSVAAVLLLVALAYWWHGNLVHEIAGTVMFGLLIAHNIINRWWYGTIRRAPRDTRRWSLLVGNLALLLPMLVLLVTSLMVSQSLFAFLPLAGDGLVRELHILAAYWVVAIFAIHLGMHWTIVMGAVARALGFTHRHPWRTMALRVTAAGLSAYGIDAIAAMSYPGKLVDPYVLDMWDFQQHGALFLINYAAIVALFATLAHYGLQLATRRNRQ